MAQKTVGQIIREFRKSKGMNGKDFSALWGGGPSTVTDIENDKKKPGYEILCALKRIGLNIDRLMQETDPAAVVSEGRQQFNDKALLKDEQKEILGLWEDINDEDRVTVKAVLEKFAGRNQIKGESN